MTSMAPLRNAAAGPFPFTLTERYTPHLNMTNEPVLASQVGQLKRVLPLMNIWGMPLYHSSPQPVLSVARWTWPTNVFHEFKGNLVFQKLTFVPFTLFCM